MRIYPRGFTVLDLDLENLDMKTPLSWRIFQLAIFDWRVPQFVNTLTKDIPKTWIAQL